MWTSLAAALALLGSERGLACGHCDGDKEAAVYSYADTEMAKQTGNPYVVAELEGIRDRDHLAKAKRALERIRGVFGPTVRVAYEQRSAAFVHDKKVSLDRIFREFEKKSDGARLKPRKGK